MYTSKKNSAARRACFALSLTALVTLGGTAVTFGQTRPPAFTVLIRTNPPPDDPNGWLIVVPTSSSTQLIGLGWAAAPGAPLTGGYEEAAAYVDDYVMKNFATSCRRAYSVWFRGFGSEKQQVIREDFAPHPIGFSPGQLGLCLWQARAILGNPMTYVSLSAHGTSYQLTLTGFIATSLPPKPPVTPPARPPVARVEPKVEEIPEGPPNSPNVGGGGGTPVVEEIPENVIASNRPPARPPAVEEIPETPVSTPPRTAPPPQQPPAQTQPAKPEKKQGGGIDWNRVGTALGGAVRESMGGQPAQGQSGGEQVGDEIRYGPFSATGQSWSATGVRLQKGQTFRWEASGELSANNDGQIITSGPDGAGWGWRVLRGKIGDSTAELGSKGQMTAWADGVLELGVPRVDKFSEEYGDSHLRGAFTVYIYVKRQ